MLPVIIRFIRNWTLPLSIVVGCLGYPIFIHLSIFTPYFIFAMLLLTFCKVPLKDLHFKLPHFLLLIVQIGGAVVAYYIFKPVSVLAAESALVCVICPTATAAAVITDKLGGSAASVTSYTLLGNLGAAIAIPLLFPYFHPLSETASFWPSFLLILKKVFPLLICPFITAMFLRRFTPNLHQTLVKHTEVAFYLWAFALIVLMAQTVNTLINKPEDLASELLIAFAALVVCCLQFFIGKRIGNRFGQRISCGQSLGQKNTVLAIWMAHIYMTPITAIGAGSYVVWQNVINSWQLWKQRKDEEAGRIDASKKES